MLIDIVIGKEVREKRVVEGKVVEIKKPFQGKIVLPNRETLTVSSIEEFERTKKELMRKKAWIPQTRKDAYLNTIKQKPLEEKIRELEKVKVIGIDIENLYTGRDDGEIYSVAIINEGKINVYSLYDENSIENINIDSEEFMVEIERVKNEKELLEIVNKELLNNKGKIVIGHNIVTDLEKISKRSKELCIKEIINPKKRKAAFFRGVTLEEMLVIDLVAIQFGSPNNKLEELINLFTEFKKITTHEERDQEIYEWKEKGINKEEARKISLYNAIDIAGNYYLFQKLKRFVYSYLSFLEINDQQLITAPLTNIKNWLRRKALRNKNRWLGKKKELELKPTNKGISELIKGKDYYGEAIIYRDLRYSYEFQDLWLNVKEIKEFFDYRKNYENAIEIILLSEVIEKLSRTLNELRDKLGLIFTKEELKEYEKYGKQRREEYRKIVKDIEPYIISATDKYFLIKSDAPGEVKEKAGRIGNYIDTGKVLTYKENGDLKIIFRLMNGYISEGIKKKNNPNRSQWEIKKKIEIIEALIFKGREEARRIYEEAIKELKEKRVEELYSLQKSKQDIYVKPDERKRLIESMNSGEIRLIKTLDGWKPYEEARNIDYDYYLNSFEEYIKGLKQFI